MRPQYGQSTSATAILTLGEIKATIEAFDRGDQNVFDALGAIAVAVEAFQNALASCRNAA